MKQIEELQSQLATAQKEIKRLKKDAGKLSCPLCGEHLTESEYSALEHQNQKLREAIEQLEYYDEASVIRAKIALEDGGKAK